MKPCGHFPVTLFQILLAAIGATSQTAQGELPNFQGLLTEGQIVNGELPLPEVLRTVQGEQPNLQGRVTQGQILNGELTLREIRLAGLRVFTTPFNKLDGYGDGDGDQHRRRTHHYKRFYDYRRGPGRHRSFERQ